MSSNKPKLAQRPRPATPKARRTTADKVSLTRSLSTSMKTSSHWSSAAELQSSVASWNASADALEANAALIAHLRDQLDQAQLVQRTTLQDWAAGTAHVFANVDILAGGDVETLQSLGFVPAVRGAPLAPNVPDHVTSLPGKLPGQAMVRWDPGVSEHRGYVVQHGTDAANAATYSAPVVSTKRRYLLTGASPASVVQFRVAAIDPSSPAGQTAWSLWVGVTVR
jgi:hypothetical protein